MVSKHVILKIVKFINEDTKYKKHCTQDNDPSGAFKVDTLEPDTVLPIAISRAVYFLESDQQSGISSLSKVILVLGNARSQGVKSGL